MPKYIWNKENILHYYEGAIEKFNKEYNGYPILKTSQYPLEEINKEKKFFKNKENDYHVELNKKKDEQEKANYWYKRLKHICYILLQCTSIKGCEQIELNIFGSEKYSSDVDIGLSYKKGTNLKNAVPLSKMIQLFESKFVNLGYTSLDLDVEMYASYFYNVKTGKVDIRINTAMYYISLPYIVSGIIKNYIQTILYNSNTYCDIRRKLKNCNIRNLNNKIDHLISINKKDFFHKVIVLPKKTIKLFDKNSKLLDKIKEIIYNYKNISIPIVKNYLTKNYKEGCKEYYKFLDLVHEEYIKPNPDFSILANYRPQALVYRAESYQSTATIEHVVYDIQQKNETSKKIVQKKKYKNIFEKKIDKYHERIKDALEKINSTNSDKYTLSILEQIGFISRYNIEMKKMNKHYTKKKKTKNRKTKKNN